jgi:hypothetical protein
VLVGVKGEGHIAGMRTEDAVVDGAEGRTECVVSMRVMGGTERVEDTRYRIARHG